MGAPLAGDPCLEPVNWPAVAGGRVRIVEILATGSNGGTQEHLFSLLSRLDRSRYDASVIALSGGSAVRKLQRAGRSSKIRTTRSPPAWSRLCSRTSIRM